jgi:NADH-quinone oxidoreductase subunit M
MSSFPILSFIIFWPLAGALFILFFVKGTEEAVAIGAKRAALWTTIFPLVLSLILWWNFDNTTHEFQFVEKADWIAGFGISYYLGVDGISLFFVVLTALLMPLCILASWETITTRVRDYMIAFLVLESLVAGVFCSLDLILFYLFFEAVLIPMFLIIGIWGGDNRVYAAFKFFLYTLLGSVLMLLAVLYLYNQFGTMSIPVLMEKAPSLPLEVQKWLWLAFLASFAVKVPMWPVHTWLPDAHVQAPTAGSVILAGVLLKMGGYGFLRLSLPLMPDASIYFADLIFGLSVVAVIYTSLVALVQEDMKKLIAYSSVAHMGFVTIGIFAFNTQGLEGSIFQMISHGLVSGALFLCVGVVYDRLHTRDIKRFGGLVETMPRYALVFMLFTMASIGLPATSGFVGELLVLVGVFQVNKLVAALAATGVILGAAYMLWLYRRVVFGELKHRDLREMEDLEEREKLIFAPLVVLVIVIGIYPSLITDSLHASVKHLETQVTGEIGTRRALSEIKEEQPTAVPGDTSFSTFNHLTQPELALQDQSHSDMASALVADITATNTFSITVN